MTQKWEHFSFYWSHYFEIALLFSVIYSSDEEKEPKQEVTTVFGDIRPEEIPEVPSQKFLLRGDPAPPPQDEYVFFFFFLHFFR